MNNLPILLFDDRCGVCHWLVRFVLRHDACGRYRFVALESPTGRRLRQEHAVNQSMDTVVLIEDERAFVRSDAVIRLFKGLGWPWRALGAVGIVPHAWRDAGYNAFAARRAAIASRLQLVCSMPTIEERTRFLDCGDPPG